MRALVPVLVLLGGGCGESFDPASLIERVRLLGGRVEIDSDPAVASPSPGGVMEVTLLVTSPDGTTPFTWGWIACAANESLAGITACAGPTFAAGLDAEADVAPPVIALEVPGEETLGGADSILFLGVVCEEGIPDPARFMDGLTDGEGACTVAGDRQTMFNFAVKLAGEGGPNHNPTFPADAITLEGAPWPEAGGDPCADGPSWSAADEALDVGLGGFAPEDREEYARVVDDPPRQITEREALTISNFTNEGELSRQFSVIEEGAETATLEWTPAEDEPLPAEGLPVRIVFVLRDGRGGADWTERTVCVRP
jgi:hypothetical protein